MEETKPTYGVADRVLVEIGGERLWLQVSRCDEERRLVSGTLDSQPIDDCDGKLALGSEVVVSFSQIREHARRGLDQI